MDQQHINHRLKMNQLVYLFNFEMLRDEQAADELPDAAAGSLRSCTGSGLLLLRFGPCCLPQREAASPRLRLAGHRLSLNLRRSFDHVHTLKCTEFLLRAKRQTLCFIIVDLNPPR